MKEIFLGRDILAKIKLLWIKMQLRIKWYCNAKQSPYVSVIYSKQMNQSKIL